MCLSIDNNRPRSFFGISFMEMIIRMTAKRNFFSSHGSIWSLFDDYLIVDSINYQQSDR